MKRKFFEKLIMADKCERSSGFTLVELLVAIAITGIVISVAGFGLVSILSASRKSEAQTLRRQEINRALSFISEDIRMSRRVNATSNTTVTASSAISGQSFNPSIGSIGTAVLYLEIPVGSCAGNPVVDRVIYDIRSNSGTSWLGPRIIDRYGRIPTSNGTIDPCSNPVASEALVDSISDTGTAPTCNSPAVLSGTEGFYACVDGRKVDLYINGKFTYSGNTDTYSVRSSAFARSTP